MENAVSVRTKKQNILNQKVKPFRRQLSQSLTRLTQNKNSNSQTIQVYSDKKNQDFPAKHRPPSASHKSSTDNPELRQSSSALKGLNMRASQIPNLSEINTQLLQEKRKLEERIAFLTNEIARETRLRNKADTAWKLHANHHSDAARAEHQQNNRSAKLNDNMNQVRAENLLLLREVGQLSQQNAEKRARIAQEEQAVRRMTAMVNNLKGTLLQEERQRNTVKGDLLKGQRVMDSLSIEAKELQNERAMLLLDINHSVVRNKL